MAKLPWSVPDISELSAERATLDLGLRRADLHYREKVVPGIGGVTFVRALTWSAIALRLREKGVKESATSLARAIEALACKAEWVNGGPDASPRVIGTRAFKRDPDAKRWSYRELKRADAYVQNTYRQVASRPLRVGLGLAEGSRFGSAALTGSGRLLADACLAERGIGRGTTVETWLKGWIRDEPSGPFPAAAIAARLSPATPTNAEREVVRERLLDAEGAERRQGLWKLLRSRKTLPEIERELVPKLEPGHAHDVRHALAFGRMYDAGLGVVAAMTRHVERARDASALAAEDEVAVGLEMLRRSAKAYAALVEASDAWPEGASGFAAAVRATDPRGVVTELARRTRGVLACSDGRVHRGPLFRRIGTIEEPGTDGAAEQVRESGGERTFRILQLHELLKDLA
jgi:hypothetical protein